MDMHFQKNLLKFNTNEEFVLSCGIFAKFLGIFNNNKK